MRLLLLCWIPVAALASEPVLPDVVEQSCEQQPASGGLVHLRCGRSRLLVVQPQPVEGSAHLEILESLMDSVSGAGSRVEVSAPLGDEQLVRTVLRQQRSSLDKGALSVELSLTTDPRSGLSAACIYGLDGKRQTERRELRWCDDMVRALLPLPIDNNPDQTVIQVTEPQLLGEDL